MPRIELSPAGTSAHERLLGHNPEILKQWLELERAFFESTSFDAHLREQVRRTLAFGNECEYCKAKAGPPDRSHAQERVSLATAFADLVGRNHRDVSEAHIALLRTTFTTAEISELIAFACFITAAQMFGSILGLGERDLPRNE
jgi:alkylhydroperoxidase family enzyme